MAEAAPTDTESGNETSLSVVIPTYRRAARLRRLLTALEPQVAGRPERQVVVVNDGSHDGAYAEVVERFRTMIEYVALPRNRGMAVARNAGANRATGRNIVFTDDDCLPPPHWLDWLVSDLEEYPYAAVVAGVTRPLPKESSGKKSDRDLFGIYPRPIYADGLLRCVPTANLAIRREWFDRVGGFDDRFFSGADTNLTYRLKRAGAPIHIDRSWFTYHDRVPGLWGFCERWFRYGRNDGMNKRLTGDASTPDPIPPSYASVVRGLPRTARQIWSRKRRPGTSRHENVVLGLRTFLSGFLFQIGLRRGFKLAARLAASPDERSA